MALQRAQDGPQSETARRHDILADAIARDVIPALVARSQRDPTQPAPTHRDHDPAAITPDQVHDLAELAWHGGSDAVLAAIEHLRLQGHSAQTLYLDLLAPAAQLLGQWWVDDVCTFADVTVGMVHLQSAMRALGPALLDRPAITAAGVRVLLLPLPGEQHTFGLQMLADFFRRAGFETSTAVQTAADLHRALGREWVDLVGFSIGSSDGATRAAGEVQAARRASRNKNLVVMVGGPACAADPGLADAIGADGTAKNGLDAVQVAESLLRSRR